MSTLYELTGEYMMLMAMAEDDDIDADALRDTMESITGEIEDKADAYGKIIKSLEGDVSSIEAEIKRLTAKKQTEENKITAMKNNLENSMEITGKRKIKTQLFSFNIQKNPPSLAVLDEESIPDEFWIEQDPKLDKRAALAYVKEHGNQTWGELLQSESLRIR